MVRVKGLEPSWGCPHTDLNRTRLPIPPHPHLFLLRDLGRKQEKMIQDMRAARKGHFRPCPRKSSQGRLHGALGSRELGGAQAGVGTSTAFAREPKSRRRYSLCKKQPSS